jgi:hypothetical protein
MWDATTYIGIVSEPRVLLLGIEITS